MIVLLCSIFFYVVVGLFVFVLSVCGVMSCLMILVIGVLCDR